MKTEYKHLVFSEQDLKSETKVFRITTKSGDFLGYVEWYSIWGQYCFYSPATRPALIFTASHLADIQNFLNQLMQEHKGKKEGWGEIAR